MLINEEAVKAQALKMGMHTMHGELTDGQKVMARSELIFKQLSSFVQSS